jgi:hypothetical protein
METLLSVLIGIGLSAACGFRVFVPLLVMSVAAHSGHLSLAQNFQWIGSDAALIAFAVATALEVAGYYIPWFDHLLDTIATPAAIVAGTICTAAMVSDTSPFLKWSLAIIAGGGTAGIIQGATVITRGASTATTGGLGNWFVATLELLGSVVMSVLSVVVPVLGICLIILLMVLLLRKVGPRIFRKRALGLVPPQN